jgi:tetratricopeptide (TPR) repeat protein
VIPTTSGPIVSLAPPSIAGEFAGRYTVERELGRGATSVVWLARDREHGRMVAIKILREELAAGVTAERFLREVQVTAQLHHPHIVPVLHSGEYEGRLFFVLPYLDGGTLRERLQREKQLPVPDVVAIGVTIASALAIAHEKNVLHRDVKPENILFTGGQACLADFGIARAMVQLSGESTTSTGIVRGTPAYMSPEQAGGDRDYDGRSDLYSLACVLYEALAGVPAFLGATSAQIVAQRLLHVPRPVRVYRASVSAELEAVLEKALARAPADRYQNAQQFRDALAGVPLLPTTERNVSRLRAIRIAAAMLGIALLGTTVMFRSIDRFVPSRVPLDTSRVAILPFTDSTRGQFAGEDLLYEGLRRWKGLSLVENFEVGDAIRQSGSPVTASDARAMARRVGAGRFVRGRISHSGAKSRVVASIFDTRSGRLLHETAVMLPVDSTYALSPYLSLADSLALRGANSRAAGVAAADNRNLPAIQSALQAMAALGEWNLATAESLYARALEYEPTSARAAFWTAQLRSWRSVPTDRWRALAVRAVADPADLNDEERELARGLAALGDGDFVRACRIYDSITVRRSRSFAAWFGAGQCIDRDHLVVADSRAASGWRFRSSYQRAIDAYLHAFELFPSVYQSYQGAAYSSLLNQLYVSGRNRRPGFNADTPPRQFLGSLTLDADTLAFAVYPYDAVAAGQTSENSAAATRAVERARQLFRRATSAWATAFPASAGAKQGLALALELEADPAAIDTLDAARRLSRDPEQRLLLLGGQVWLALKFGMPGRLDLLREARHAADSALRSATPATREGAEILARLAALTGRCSVAADFADRAAAGPATPSEPGASVVGQAQARAVLTALGCGIPGVIPTIDELVTRSGLDQLPFATRAAAEVQVFGREIRASEPLNLAWARRLAPSGDYLIQSRVALADGHPELARQRLTEVQLRRRGKIRGYVAPDAIVPESRVWLALGDSSAARRLLDDVLRDAPYWAPATPGEPDNALTIAWAIRAMVARAQLATNTSEARTWARAVLALWDGADRDLQPTVNAMKALVQH